MWIGEIVWLIAVVVTAVAGGVVLFHVLEVPGRSHLNYPHVVAVYQTLYRGHRTFGAVVEPLALLLTAAAAVFMWGQGGARLWLALSAALLMLVMQLAFPLVTEQCNKQIVAWDRHDPPPQWRKLVRRWELSHAVRAGLMTSAAGLLASAALV
jgi:hypothetical protein